jgi:hypothetical protein
MQSERLSSDFIVSKILVEKLRKFSTKVLVLHPWRSPYFYQLRVYLINFSIILTFCNKKIKTFGDFENNRTAFVL